MHSSRSFWAPVVVGLVTTCLGIFWLLMMAMAGGAHAAPDRTSPALGTLLFPFASLFEGGGQGSGLVAGIFFLIQFPIYGAVIGYGNSLGRPKPYLLTIATVHIVALFLATLAN